MSLTNYLEVRKELDDLLEQQNFRALKEKLQDLNEVDIAEFINECSSKEASIIFRMLPKTEGADVFSYLDQDNQINLINSYTDKEIEDIVSGLYNDDYADLLDEIPASVAKRLLKNTKPERRKLINQLLQYPDESAGSIMTTEYMRLTSSMTIKEAIFKLRHSDPRMESIYTCYVTSSDLILEGVLTIQEILTAKDEQLIADIMTENVICAHTVDDQEYATRMLDRYDFLALPVVDSENRLVGIITVDDAMTTLNQETSEDMAIMAAVQPTEKSYFEVGVWENARHRVLWLLVLMISGMVNGEILSTYEHAFVAIPALVSFIPMLTDTGGNAGSQTSSLLIRAIALGEAKLSDIIRIIWREFSIGVIVGSILSLVNFLRIYFLNGQPMVLALTVSLALFAVVILAKFIAGTLPLIAKALGFDPAMMAAPLITTIVDAMGLILYFNIAHFLLRI